MSLVVLHLGRVLEATSQGNFPPALASKESSRREPHFLSFAEDQPLSALLAYQYHTP